MIFNGDLVVAALRRWPLAAAATAAVFLLAVGFGLMQPKVYSAKSSVLFAVNEQDPASGARTDVEEEYIFTQREVMRSLVVAGRVAEMVPPAPNEEGKTPSPASWARQLRGKVSLVGGSRSNVVELTVEDENPARAAEIANAFAEAYLDTVPELQANTAQDFAKWLEIQTADTRTRLEEAQTALAEFQQASGAIGSRQIDVAAEGIRTLNSQLAQAESESVSAAAREGAAAPASGAALSAVQGLRADVAAQRAMIAQLGQTYGPNHETMIAARSQLSALNSELRRAEGDLNRVLAAEREAAAQREAALRERLSSRQGELIDGVPVQSQMTRLQNEVDAAQREYESVRQRLSEVFLLSQMSEANARLLDRAYVSNTPVAPNIPVLGLLGLVVGGMIGVSLVVGLEWLDPRVRTREGLEDALGIPVLADMASSNRSRTAALRLEPPGDPA